MAVRRLAVRTQTRSHIRHTERSEALEPNLPTSGHVPLRRHHPRGVRSTARRLLCGAGVLVLRDWRDSGGEGPGGGRSQAHRAVSGGHLAVVAAAAEAGRDRERAVPAAWAVLRAAGDAWAARVVHSRVERDARRPAVADPVRGLRHQLPRWARACADRSRGVSEPEGRVAGAGDAGIGGGTRGEVSAGTVRAVCAGAAAVAGRVAGGESRTEEGRAVSGACAVHPDEAANREAFRRVLRAGSPAARSRGSCGGSGTCPGGRGRGRR